LSGWYTFSDAAGPATPQSKNDDHPIRMSIRNIQNRWRDSGRRGLLLAAITLTGCAGYQPLPLPDQDNLAPALDAIQIDRSAMISKPAQQHLFDPADGLDMWETAMLAVANNPELRAARARRGVAGAQVYAARLFPDPQISAGLDHPTGNATGLVNAYAYGLSYDIIPLVTRGTGIESASAAQQKIVLDLLWQEWQTIEQARSLHVELVTLEQKVALLARMLDLYQQRYQHSSSALAKGDLTVDVTGTDLTALLDTATQLNQTRQARNNKQHDLALLLGLSPDVSVRLQAPPAAEPVSESDIAGALQALPQRRPDLLALSAGYTSQEALVHRAVLSQFPSIGLGVSRARDTSDVNTSGLSISLTLPLFSGNRGNIAIEQATREQLRAEYQARLDQSRIDVLRLLGVQSLIAEQQQLLNLRVPELESMVVKARKAYQGGDISALTFLNMQTTWVNKKLEQLDLAQQSWTTRLALETLLGEADVAGKMETDNP
jgi:cobalt-zinc-cadmium efflux system outer membrane protein